MMTIAKLLFTIFLLQFIVCNSFAACSIPTYPDAIPVELIDNNDSCNSSNKINQGGYDDCYADYADDIPITTDSRIKTNIYNPNEVYLIVFHYGFQSNIEFGNGEEVETISLGDTFGWQITTLGRRLIIRPLEKSIKTNMTVITNKRTYQFDLVSKDATQGYEKDLVYVTKFYYPKKKCR